MPSKSKKFAKNAGLLACTYQAIYNPDVNKQVRSAYLQVLADYNLSPQTVQLAENVSKTSDPASFAQLVDLLSAELANHYRYIFNHTKENPNG